MTKPIGKPIRIGWLGHGVGEGPADVLRQECEKTKHRRRQSRKKRKEKPAGNLRVRGGRSRPPVPGAGLPGLLGSTQPGS